MKDGWVIAIGEYHGITIYLKHINILECYSESILCPLTETYAPYPITQTILNSAGSASMLDLKTLSVSAGSSRDISSGSLLQSRLIMCIIPASIDSNKIVQAYSTGLEISNSLGCNSASIPLVQVTASLQVSADLIIESIEHYALSYHDRNCCMREVIVCAQSSVEINALLEASKFRMTRYSTFVSLGLPNEKLLPESYYCYQCYTVILLSNKCEHA